jgi:hypothetical protein
MDQLMKLRNTMTGELNTQGQVLGGVAFNVLIMMFIRWVLKLFLSNWFAELVSFGCFCNDTQAFVKILEQDKPAPKPNHPRLSEGKPRAKHRSTGRISRARYDDY